MAVHFWPHVAFEHDPSVDELRIWAVGAGLGITHPESREAIAGEQGAWRSAWHCPYQVRRCDRCGDGYIVAMGVQDRTCGSPDCEEKATGGMVS